MGKTKKSRRTNKKYSKRKKIKYTKRDNNRKHKTNKKLKGGSSSPSSPFQIVSSNPDNSPITLEELSSKFNRTVLERVSSSPALSPLSPSLSPQSDTSSTDFQSVRDFELCNETPSGSRIYLGSTFIKNKITDSKFFSNFLEIELTVQKLNVSTGNLFYRTQPDLSLPKYTVIAYFDNIGTTHREPEPAPATAAAAAQAPQAPAPYLPPQLYDLGATVISGFYWGASSILNMLMEGENIQMRYGVILTDDLGKKYVAEVVETGEEEGEKYYEPVLEGGTPKRILDYTQLLEGYNFIVISFIENDGRGNYRLPEKTIESDYDESRYLFKLGKNPGLIIGEVGFDSFSEDLLKVEKIRREGNENYKITFKAQGNLKKDYLSIEWESFKQFIKALNSLPDQEKRDCGDFINEAHQGLSGVLQGITDTARSVSVALRDTAKTTINKVKKVGADDIEIETLEGINCGEDYDYSFKTRRAEQIVCVILRLIKCGFLPQIIGFFTRTGGSQEDSRELSITTGRETVVSTNMFQNTLSLALNVGKDTILSGINIFKIWFQTLLIGLLRHLGIKSFEKLILELQKEILTDRMSKFQRVEGIEARLRKYTKHIGFELAKKILKDSGREGASRFVGVAQAASTLKDHYDKSTINKILTELSTGGIEMVEVLYHIFIILYGACATGTDKNTLPSLDDITNFFSSPLSAIGGGATLIKNMFSSMYKFLRAGNLPSEADYIAMRVVEEEKITQNFESELGELKRQLRESEEQLRESRSLEQSEERAYLSKEIEALEGKISNRIGEKQRYNETFKEEYRQLADAKTFDEAFSKIIKASSEARDLWNMLCNALSGCTVDSDSLLINTEKIQVAARHLLGASREYNSMSDTERQKFISFLNFAQGIEGDPHGAIASMFQPNPELTSGAPLQLTQGGRQPDEVD